MYNDNQKSIIKKAVEGIQEAIRLFDNQCPYSAKQAIKDALGLLDNIAEEQTVLETLYGASSDKEVKEISCYSPERLDSTGLY